MAVESYSGKLAVVTGGGSGMGRELVRQLAAQGCSVAACDLNPDAVAVTAATAWAAAPRGVRVTSHVCDVSDEAQVLRFRDELLEQHASDHLDLVFANAGVVGGASFVKDSMPGVVSTDIADNSRAALGLPELEQLSDAELLELLPESVRAVLIATGLLAEDFSADDSGPREPSGPL